MLQISNEPHSKYSYLNEWLTLERESIFFLPEYPCPFGKSVCAELLFGSVLVHIISFECPLKKNIYSKKKKEKKEKEAKEKKRKGLILEIFRSLWVVCCALLCVQARVSSTY